MSVILLLDIGIFSSNMQEAIRTSLVSNINRAVVGNCPPITHLIHMLSSLKFGGKNPVTWLLSRAIDSVDYVTHRFLPKAGVNEVILPVWGGRGYVELSQAWVACHFSRDFTTYLFIPIHKSV
jgi:hypothetical protein